MGASPLALAKSIYYCQSKEKSGYQCYGFSQPMFLLCLVSFGILYRILYVPNELCGKKNTHF